MPESVGPAEREAALVILAAVEDFVEEHERREHEGEICVDNRASLLAWLAHRLGFRGEAGVLVLARAIAVYEIEHRQQEGGHGRNGHGH